MQRVASLHTITLDDGRQVAYRVFGDPLGFVVISCHGGLMSGLDAAISDADARARGIALVSPDRPGIGGTSRRPGHRMCDWVRDDLTALLQHLEAQGARVDRFGVTGWSEGGQYALAVGHAFPERVTRVVVVAGALPLDDPATFARLNRTDATMARLSHRAPLVARALFAGSRILSRRFPRFVARVSGWTLDASDAAVLMRESAWFAGAIADGMADARGGVEEYHAFVGPWGFRPEDVRVPVVVHQGGADRLIPAAWGEALVGRLPDARLRAYPGEGHFIVVSRRAELLDEFAEFVERPAADRDPA